MSDNLQITDFTPCLEQNFSIPVNEQDALAAQLIEVKELSFTSDPRPAGQKMPFSLVFQIENNDILPQQIYTMENETLGKVELFLVPIGQDEKGTRYEALFN